jgi:cytochrome c oxidase subunit 3
MTRRQGSASADPANLAIRLLILSLAMLFTAGLIGYGVTRARLGGDVVVQVPGLLWASTAALLLCGLLLDAAWRHLRSGRADSARTLLQTAGAAAIGFLALQIPALQQLLAGHAAAVAQGNPLLGFVFFLVLLHGLHVVVGTVALGRQLVRTRRRGLRLETDGPAVRLLSRYWRFLDLVWLVMFGVFLLG